MTLWLIDTIHDRAEALRAWARAARWRRDRARLARDPLVGLGGEIAARRLLDRVLIDPRARRIGS